MSDRARLADGRSYYGYEVYGIADSDRRGAPHGCYVPPSPPDPRQQFRRLAQRLETVEATVRRLWQRAEEHDARLEDVEDVLAGGADGR